MTRTDIVLGQCNYKDNVFGRQCDECVPGYWGFRLPPGGHYQVRMDGRWALDTGCEIQKENLKQGCNVLTSGSDLDTARLRPITLTLSKFFFSLYGI